MDFARITQGTEITYEFFSALQMVELYTADMVSAKGYDGIVTVNSHPVTAVSSYYNLYIIY